MKNFIKEIISYRGFIISSVKREFQSKYRSSLLGPIWIFAQPISLIFVYTVVFSTIMKSRIAENTSPIAYSIFLCSGIIFWNYFSEIINKCTVVFIQNANIIKKLSFPKACLPIIISATSTINFTIISMVFIVVMVATHSLHPLSILYVTPLVVLLLFFAIVFGMILGLINVFFRDVGHFIGVFMQFWFWLTPIVYPISILPEWSKEIVRLNPLTGIIVSSQNIFLKGELADIKMLFPIILSTILLLSFGWVLYKKRFADMVDEL